MSTSIRAELLKLRKRPAVWIIFGLLIAMLVVFGYLFTYVFVVAEDSVATGADGQLILSDLLPASFVANALRGLTGFGGAFGLILGALAVGSEYGWGTTKTLATQGPARRELSTAKLAGLLVVTLAFAVAYLGLAMVSSLLVANLEGSSSALPSAGAVLGGLGASWLILSAWTALGAALAVLLRGTGLAIGLGLVYVLVLENLALGLPLPDGVSQALQHAMISSNAFALAQSFGDLAMAPMQDLNIAAGQATGVLALYLVVFAVVGGSVFHRRSIT